MTRFALVAALLGLAAPAQAQGTLEKIRAAGALVCGVITEATDYGKQDTHGGLDDFAGEFCKAVAAAALGEAARATVTGYPDEQAGFRALVDGGLDLLAGVTPTPSNGALYRVVFGPPIFLDGQGFMVEAGSGIASVQDLAGRQVCFIAATEHEARLLAVLRARGISVLPYPWEETGEMDAGLTSGHCAAMTSDISDLAEQRAAFHGRRADFVILPETITLDPLAPAVRQGDPQWAAIVTWTVEALIQAEASGVTQANVAALRGGDDPVLRRLLGADRAAAQSLGLADDWAVQAIRAAGNYGEIFSRTIGPGTAMNLPRGSNALWTQGGLLYPLPVR